MTMSASAAAVLMERLREFDRVASMLDMPAAERHSILNVSEHVYAGLRSGRDDVLDDVRPELERRLGYALPLMRKLAGNSPVLRLSSNLRLVAA